jgi:predicted nuclease of predicted toxin-antitoxin system
MKILVDMNLPPRWVQLFAHAGWEALHWSQVGSPTASDREIMAWARENGYIVFTRDLDFSALLAAPREKAPASSRFVRKISSLNI